MQEKITVLTAYDFNTARALEEACIDYILVGDSLAMVGFGYKNTQKINLGTMVACTRAVKRGAPKTPIITDMPKVEADKLLPDFLKACKQIKKAGADIIKIENAKPDTLEKISAAIKEGYTIMGHLGYTPQSFDKPTLVKDEDVLMRDAKILESLGVMGIVLEMVPSLIAKTITESLSLPTIGIGAGVDCSGQVLVSDDMLGRFNLFSPKFLRRYSNQYEDSVRAFSEYIKDVKSKNFPSEAESY
jgi:3-methyl-2-oxobutanoate hydroxymethyltransferase